MVKKPTKWEMAILATAALFLAFTAGWFLRGSTAGEPLRVETERRLERSETVLALPAPEKAEEGPKVNINTATAEELCTLPGIGEKRAQDIIADRERNGPFRFPEDITRVKGIGEETMNGFLDRITVEDEP